MNPQTCWKAVQRRDALARPRFWYAVKTTGVYCRPGCPARLPRRENVEFFMDARDAQVRGYRPCRRCKPDQPDTDWTERMCAHIHAHLDGHLTLQALGRFAEMSPSHLQRKFKASVGISPREYVDQKRLEAFKRGARRGDSVTESLYGAGFGAGSRLYEQAHRRLGMTPAEYRRGGAGVRIHYTLWKSALGPVTLAATARGICAVRFGNCIEELRREFPDAEFVKDDAALLEWKNALLAHIAGERFTSGLPLDVQATAFQRRVWNYLRTIPVGETRTYSAVAAGIRQPTAARAIAQACARNPVAVLVPCHRVLSAYGKKMGYRWGSQRKRDLLQSETGAAPQSFPELAGR